ncbi:RNA polymerase II associated protein 1 [Mortierella claussenii]|nr:RNA polymerase II associated protein 1 [Mortierella claussenii]
MNPGQGDDDSRRRMEHESVMRQRKLAPETEDDLLALQEEFLKANDRPAAAVVRVKRPTVVSSSSSGTSTAKNTTVQDGDDIPPPLEKDVVSLDSDDLPLHPPTVHASTSALRAGSRFLQDRANKGPRTHFATPPQGQRFNIDLDDNPDDDDDAQEEDMDHTGGRRGTSARTQSHSHRHDDMQDDEIVETEEETRRRLNSAGLSMGQILHEVLEKPVGEAVAPLGATTTLGSLAPSAAAIATTGKAAPKGKSLFAKRLAEAQGKESPSSEAPRSAVSGVAEPSSNAHTLHDRPASAAYTSFMSRAEGVTSPKKDVVTFPSLDDAVPVKPSVKFGTRPTSYGGVGSNKGSPSRTGVPLHSVLKKTPDSPHSTLMDQINEENQRKLASMSQEEIEGERAELLRNLDPELIKKLMKRSTVQRRVSFSEGIKVEDKVVSIHEMEENRADSTFQAKRHEEEEGDHPLALKKKYYADVPAEPEKLEWMGIEDTEEGEGATKRAPGKSIAPGAQPYTVSEADPPAAHYRFDFSGMIITQEDMPAHLGLHHHGVDPTKAGYTLSELLHLIRSTVPSQRILPLNVVAKVLHNCRNSDYAPFDIRAGILRWLIDTLRAPVYIRAALDDKTDSGIVAAVNALYAWTLPQSNLGLAEDVWESVDHLDRGYERISLGFKYQTITRFANMELKPDTLQASQEQGAESEETIAAHAILASKDPVDGLLAMNILPRFRYLLDVCQLPVFTNSQILDILLTIVRSNAGAAKKVFECEGLIAALIRHYGAISWPSDKSDLELSCTIKALAIVDIVIRSSKKIASEVIQAGYLEPLLRFLVATPEATVEQKMSFAIQTQALKVLRSLAAYGLYCNVLGESIQTMFLQDLSNTITEHSKSDLDPAVKSCLTRKLSMLFQLATAWTHASADAHRTTPEHSLCWAHATVFLEPALKGIALWNQPDNFTAFSVDHTLLVSSAVRYISTWVRYLPTHPADSDQILGRIWETLQFSSWIKSAGFESIHEQLLLQMQDVPNLVEPVLPHVGVTMTNPASLSRIASRLFEVSLCCEYFSSHLTTMYYLARLTVAQPSIRQETIQTLVSEAVFGLVEQVTKFELAIQDQIPTVLPPWTAFLARHGVYFVAHWLTAMDVLVYQQDPENSSHIKLTFFPLFQVTALSLLQIVLPGDESLSHDVLTQILFNPRVLSKLLSQNTHQIVVVKRILEPMYLQYFIKSNQELERSKSLWRHDGRGIQHLVMDYGGITGQPLFNWLFYPIELLFKTKLTYVEESRTMIAATSVVHCTLDFVYSLLQTLDGISFELIYMAALKVLALEGEKEPQGQDDEDEDEYVRGDEEEEGAAARKADSGEEEEEEEEEEEDGFMDQEVDATINKLLDHFSTRGDCALVQEDAQNGRQTTLNDKTLSLLTSPLPFSQFMKNFMENSFTTGTLLQFQRTAARFLFPAMAISTELQLLIWQESFNFLGSVTTTWQELDPGTLRSLIKDDAKCVNAEVLKHYLKAVVSGRVIKQRNPALYWIAVHHLASVAFGPVKMPPPPSSRSRTTAAAAVEDGSSVVAARDENLSKEELAMLEERRSIVRAIVGGTKSEELVRDWVQYDGRNFEQSVSGDTASTLSRTLTALTAKAGAGVSPSTGGAITVDTQKHTSASASASASAAGSTVGSPVTGRTPSSSRPLSLLSTSALFPAMGSSDYLNCDNILTPPECFLERRQLMVKERKKWIERIVGEEGLERVEDAIFNGGSGGGNGDGSGSASATRYGPSSASAHGHGPMYAISGRGGSIRWG